MNIIPTYYTVSDYCDAMKQKDVIMNYRYQRSNKVWSDTARSFLIETILLNYPMPKFCLHQITDIKSQKTYKEIVDGQQRSQAIFDFYNDKFALSRSSDIKDFADRKYSELYDEYQENFQNYIISIDLLTSATSDNIRETFKRISSYTVPLNPEEKRHSMYQGAFKWFIYNLSKKYDQNLLDMGVFTENQLVRMADMKLYSEIIHAFRYGITATSSNRLNNLYKDFDDNFPDENEISKRFDKVMNVLLGIKEIHQGPLMKSYNIYSLILAFSYMKDSIKLSNNIKAKRNVTNFNMLYNATIPYKFKRDIVVSNLTKLAEALEETDDAQREFEEFISATTSITHGQKNREIRFKWFCKALEPKLL